MSEELERIHRKIHRMFRLGEPYPSPIKMRSRWKRVHLPALFNVLGYRTGAEIGVEYGVFASLLCAGIPGLNLKLVDHWEYAYEKTPAEKQDEIYEIALKNLAPFPNLEFIKKTSVEAAKCVPEKSLDFVYIDASHDFDSVMIDLIVWSPKVKQYGIVAGHDYMPYGGFGVITAVDSYTRAHHITRYYMTGDRVSPSFFWVKPYG